MFTFNAIIAKVKLIFKQMFFIFLEGSKLLIIIY